MRSRTARTCRTSTATYDLPAPGAGTSSKRRRRVRGGAEPSRCSARTGDDGDLWIGIGIDPTHQMQSASCITPARRVCTRSTATLPSIAHSESSPRGRGIDRLEHRPDAVAARARLRPAQQAFGHGHSTGLRHCAARSQPKRDFPHRHAHPDRGQGRCHRLRSPPTRRRSRPNDRVASCGWQKRRPQTRRMR